MKTCIMKYFLSIVIFLSVYNSFSQIGPLCYSEPFNYAASSLPYDISSADFNNDGKVDIAVVNAGTDTLSVILNSGNGVFTATSNYKVGLNPWRVITLDLNSDGNIDIVTVNSTNGSNLCDISVLLGNGTGFFPSVTNYSVGPTPVSIAPGDFNHDGKIDLAVSGIIDTHFLYGQGNGMFNQAFTYNLGWTGMSSTSGDFNSDGFLDLAFIDAGSGSNMSVFLGTSTFLSTYYVGGVDCWSMLSNDYNNDGLTDIAVCNPDHVFLLFGGAFNAPVTYPLNNNQALGMTSSDINGDGYIDLIVANTGKDNVSILFGSYNGVFTLFNTEYTSGVGTIPFAVTSSDFNGDGLLDIATANYNSSDISILLNRVKPNVTISASTNSLCIGSGVTLQANGAYTYSWNTGDTTAINYQIPLTDMNYIVTGKGINYCVNTQSTNIIVDNTCADVWPGDANSDGRVDNIDVLELGLHYTQTGTPRTSTSNSWQSFHADNWTGTISNGKNLNHSDCNGDGTIDASDTLAIYNNYGLTHAFKAAQTNTVSPQLSIVPDQTSVVKGTWGTASIYLGNATTNINNINGVAFTVDFDNALIEPSNIWIEYLPSFIDASQNLHFRKLDFANSKLFTASTHTVSNNVSGFGKIATLHYQIKSTLTTDQVLNIGLSQANQSNVAGTIVPLTSSSTTLMAIGASVGLQELSGNIITISPNPTNGSLTIKSNTELQKIEVLSVDGKILLSEVPTNILHTMNLDNFANGIYFVNLYQNNRIVKREKVVLNK